MNVGYSSLNSEVDNQNCPICNNNIYVSKYYNDYACVDQNCPLGHGARKLVKDVSKILDMLTKTNKPSFCGYVGECESKTGCQDDCECRGCKKGSCIKCISMY